MNASDDNFATQVLVVGAGPVGLSLAVELGLRGIDMTIIDQRDRTGPQPRAKTTNVRTMTHMRRWGIADALRAAAPLPYDYPFDVVFATKLFGHTLNVFENVSAGAKRRDPRFPEPAQWVPQYIVEKVLHEKLSRLPSVRFQPATAFERLSQSETGVSVTVRDVRTDATRVVHAAYVVGADGARSLVRGAIGAKMTGEYAMSHTYSVVLRIPELAASPPDRKAVMYWLVNPESPGVFNTIDGSETWGFGVGLSAGESDIPDDEMIGRVQAAVGRKLKMEILERDRWAAHRLIADHYRDRRVFLAGDACHLHPPYGGYGMNLGIADAVDLGWKLGAVLAGWGGEALLSSYEQERRAVHERTIAEAIENFRTLNEHLLKAGLDEDTAEGARVRADVAEEIRAKKAREFNTLGVVLGSRYINSPIIVADSSSPPIEHPSEFQPSAHPGCLAPHAWLADGASLYDRLGDGYTLLILDAAAEAQAAQISQASDAAGVPLKVLDLTSSGLAPLYEAPLALIRPDQFVAWRGDAVDAAALVETVRGSLLSSHVLSEA
jgi:2-polyprenyl-6-methoxyphenol hydroxylase-like FAD-dependent oxidoreductase